MLLRLALQVAARHVEADGIAEDMVERLFGAGCSRRPSKRHDELDLVMHVAGGGGVGEVAAVRGTTLSGFFWKKKGGSLFGSCPISIAWSA